MLHVCFTSIKCRSSYFDSFISTEYFSSMLGSPWIEVRWNEWSLSELERLCSCECLLPSSGHQLHCAGDAHHLRGPAGRSGVHLHRRVSICQRFHPRLSARLLLPGFPPSTGVIHVCRYISESVNVEFVCNVLVVADQLLITRLKEICEVVITENRKSCDFRKYTLSFKKALSEIFTMFLEEASFAACIWSDTVILHLHLCI